jgi:hypothetical protein
MVDREDVTAIVAEEQYAFIRGILMKIDLPLEGCLPESAEDFTVERKIKFRQLLAKFQVSIREDTLSGRIEIYVDQDLVAWWNSPGVVLKQDLAQSDPKKQLYAEITLDSWSVFEEKDI